MINFPVQFKEFPNPKKYPYEKKLDESIDKMIEEYADLFLMWCLTNGYEYAQKTGVQYPKSVQESTNIYKKDCDLIAQFKDEFIEKSFVTTDKLRWNTVLNAYTRYYKSHHTGRLPRVVDLRRSFEKALGEKLHNYEWAGWLMPTPCTSGFELLIKIITYLAVPTVAPHPTWCRPFCRSCAPSSGGVRDRAVCHVLDMVRTPLRILW